MSSGYSIEQRWSIRKRKPLNNKWNVKDLDSQRIVHTSKSYSAAVKWVRKGKPIRKRQPSETQQIRNMFRFP